jgi:hypothetical protein
MKLLLFLLCTPIIIYAQPIKYKKDWASDITDNTYAPKRIFLNAYYCLPNLLASEWKYLEAKADYQLQTKLFIGGKIDYAFNKRWSAGVGYQIQKVNTSWGENYKDSISQQLLVRDQFFSAINHSVALTGQLHVFSNYRWDVFVNGEAGSTYVNYTATNTAVQNKIKTYGLLGGGFRFFATKKLALQIIGGVGSSHNLQVGSCWRLGL